MEFEDGTGNHIRGDAMAYIYKISNRINDKVYIGKTLDTIENRWKRHLCDSRNKRFQNIPLYKVMNGIGAKCFYIEAIEICDDIDANNREIFWIKHYDSYNNGYNATLGGEGRHHIDYDVVIELYAKLKNQRKVARHLGISDESVSKALVQKGIQSPTKIEVSKMVCSKRINQYTIDNEYIASYDSIADAGRSLGCESKKKNIAKALSNKTKRKTAYGYIWRFAS